MGIEKYKVDIVKRNKGIDILRAVSILIIIIHHSWAIVGNAMPYDAKVFDFLVHFGGEIGVTAFFALSGYGIFYSLYNMQKIGGGGNI